jgi:hypothetical protein
VDIVSTSFHKEIEMKMKQNNERRFWALIRPMPRAWVSGKHRSDGHFTFTAAAPVIAVKPCPKFKREALR